MQFEISNQFILNADWREVLPMLSPASVDLLLTDPPYGITPIKWDKKVDWEHFWAETKRVLKENAVMVMFASGKFVPELIASNLKDYRYELIWEKSLAVGFLDARRRPLRAHEQILVFTRKGFRASTYNPQMTKGKMHKHGGQTKKKPVHYSGADRPTPQVMTDLYYPKSVLKYSNKVRGRSLHPTAKPLELVEWLVRSYSDPGDTVLDPFFGSGTTIAATLLTGRKGIGCDISPEYFEIAKQRLTEIEEVAR